MIARALALALLLLGAAAAAETPPRNFDAGSPARLRSELAGRPFVLAFWSIHCEPCIREMAIWREATARHPRVPVILVSTDAPTERERVNAFLARHDPGNARRMQYADDFEERIRFAIDPKWRGELPRTYLFDASHAVSVRTGLLDKAEMDRWLERVGATPRRAGQE